MAAFAGPEVAQIRWRAHCNHAIMPNALPLKLIEGLVLLAALVLFAWWQLRDVKREQAKSARAREAAKPDAETSKEKE
jgi:hypothetical protein